jgi:hypothetical protein
MAEKGHAFVGLRKQNTEIMDALLDMGIDATYAQRVIIDLPCNEVARVYVQMVAKDKPTERILRAMEPDVEFGPPRDE